MTRRGPPQGGPFFVAPRVWLVRLGLEQHPQLIAQLRCVGVAVYGDGVSRRRIQHLRFRAGDLERAAVLTRIQPAVDGFAIRTGLVCSWHECLLRLQARASKIRLKGVCAARRNLEKPPSRTTVRSRASPAWAPRHKPTSWERDAGVQMNVEAE